MAFASYEELINANSEVYEAETRKGLNCSNYLMNQTTLFMHLELIL